MGWETIIKPSDITDEQWALVEPHIPIKPGERPRKTSTRKVFDASRYSLRNGCQWHHLPSNFPPKSIIWRYFDEWRHNGTLETVHDALRRKFRTAEKLYFPRNTSGVASQSVATTRSIAPGYRGHT